MNRILQQGRNSAELSQMAGVKNREGAGLLADGKKTDEDSSTKNSRKKRKEKQRRSSEYKKQKLYR